MVGVAPEHGIYQPPTGCSESSIETSVSIVDAPFFHSRSAGAVGKGQAAQAITGAARAISNHCQ